MVSIRNLFALLCLGLMGLVSGHSWAQTAPSGDLQKVISQLNAAAAKFVSAQASFVWDQYQVVVQDHDRQSGTIYYERKKGATRTAAYFTEENGKDAHKTMVYDNGEVNFYQPEIKQITIMRAGANKGQWESFLTLGFGGSGSDLEANWNVTLQGTETIDVVSVAKLDLVPKEQKVLDMFSHVTIWVDPIRGVSLKQIFYEPSGDNRTATYKNIRYNEPIKADIFRIDAPPGTTKVVK